MSRFAIIVEFKLRHGRLDQFHAEVLRNAKGSLDNEPGCQRFDVLVPEEQANRIVLYEIYDDEAVFQAHLQTPHFAAFDGIVRDWVAERSIARFKVSDDGLAGKNTDGR
jgi:quinol monooxygenase YgiN